MFIARQRASDLEQLTELIEAGKLRPNLERTFTLDQAALAIRHVGGRTGSRQGRQHDVTRGATLPQVPLRQSSMAARHFSARSSSSGRCRLTAIVRLGDPVREQRAEVTARLRGEVLDGHDPRVVGGVPGDVSVEREVDESGQC